MSGIFYRSKMLLRGLSIGCLWMMSNMASAHDVPGLTPAMLDVHYWLAKQPHAEQLLLNRAQIEAHNQALFAQVSEMHNVTQDAAPLSKAALQAKISALSAIPSAERFNADGVKIGTTQFAKLTANLALDSMADSINAQFALVTSRGIIRSFPSWQRVFNSGMDTDIDRFQETGVFPGQLLHVWHYSLDRNWAFVCQYHYCGWLEVQHFGLTDKTTALSFNNAGDFVVVTGAQIRTNFTPEVPQVSQVALDMGVRLPLLKDVATLVNDQNPACSYVVQLPTRARDGRLQLITALIGRNQDVSVGYLPMTRGHIIRQAFKFLGERYGWGHDFNARDCSGFIGEVYKTFGLLLPRNTSTLGKQPFAREIKLDSMPSAEKTKLLNTLDVGDILLIPGHVMMVLGYEKTADGQPQLFVIHSVNGMSYYTAAGQYYQSKLNGVSITPFAPLQLNQQTSFVDALYNIKILTGRPDANR